MQEWLKTERLRNHIVSTHDNPADQGHDPSESDQVRTCSELARVNLHRYGPTCTVTPITTTLTVLKNTADSIQNHSELENNDQNRVDDAKEELINPLPKRRRKRSCRWDQWDMASLMCGMVGSCTTSRRQSEGTTLGILAWKK